jgi:3-hydroxyacyl-CoA dehydrogenase
MVIEAVFEEMGVKEQVFRTLDEVMKPGAILATNTSTLDVDRIAFASRSARRTSSACTSSARPT